MNNINNNKLTTNFDNVSQQIQFTGFHETSTVKATKKVAKENFVKKSVNKIENPKKPIKVIVNGEKYLIKVKDLAESLHISKDVVKTARKNGFLRELIELTLEAKHYHVPYQDLAHAYETGEIEKVRYFEHLADSYELPLGELLEAEKQGRAQDLLKELDKVEIQCQTIFQKLDGLYTQTQGSFVTKGQDERFEMNLTPAELRSIKSTVKTALRSFAIQTTSKMMEKIVPITDKHSVMVKSSKDSLEVIGLFGKLLGQGAAGVAAQRLNLLEGKWDTGKEAIIKIPSAADIESEQIIQEVMVLNKIHEKGPVLGIQKPLRLVKDVFKGTARHCHLGAMYQTDLAKGLSKSTLSSFEKKSIAYQLMRGLEHLHKLNMTHGDIKLENIFLNFDQGPTKNEKETRVYLGDFGGAIMHQTNKAPPLQLQITDLYRFDSDMQASKNAHKSKDFKTYQEIEEKADVFAMCSVICSVCTGQMPYNKPIEKDYQINNQLKQDLKKAGLNQETIQLLMKGLSLNYQERPSAAMLVQSIGKEFQAVISQ